MDEEELEQPRKKITISNFFESIQSIDKVANRALKKTKSNLGIISKNKSLIEALSKSFDNIRTEIKEIKTEVKEYITIEKDLDKDKLFAQEDQEQKIKRLERLQGIEGDKVDPADNAAGTTDDSEFQKKAAETVKKALQNPDVVSILTGLIGLSVAGLMGAGANVVGDVKKRTFSEKTGGFLDFLTDDLTDFDRRGVDEKTGAGKPKTYGKFFGGVVDFFTANAFDLDKSGDFINSREDLERMKKLLEERRERKRVGLNQGGLVFDNDNDTSNNNKDSVPAMLTPGEFVVTKDAVDKIGVDTLKGLNASVGAKEKGVFKVDKLMGGLKKMFSGGKETTRSLQNLSDVDYYYLGLAISGEAKLGSDDEFAVAASILNRVSSKDYKNNVKDVVLSSDTADGTREYEALNILDVNNPKIQPEVKKYLENPNIILSRLKSESGEQKIIEMIEKLDGRTNYKGQKQISNRVEKEDPMFDPKGNFFHYNFQETPQTLRNATEEQKNYRPPTTEDFVKQIEPKPTGLMRVVSGVLDAVTGDKYDFDGRSSDNLQSVIESKSDQLAQNIFTPPTTESNKVNLLPIPINQQQSQSTDGNVSVTAPKNTPQVTTTPVASTMSSVGFINMISNKQLSIG